MSCIGAGVVLALAAVGSAAPRGLNITDVAAANRKQAGIAAPDVLSPELAEQAVATGATPLENPTPAVPYYGYDGDGPHVPVLTGTIPNGLVEATKTEPDKNTYLVLPGQRGADAAYDYGTRFLFQGHEGGAPGAITRVNLDADGAHRVTLMATADSAGRPLPTFDGSTWDPYAHRLLFTAERGTSPADQQAEPPTVNPDGGVWQAGLEYPSVVQDVSGVFGRGGFEGVQNDSAGNVWVVEDIGGDKGTGANADAKQPNSFVYRLVPRNPADLTVGGRLEALQVDALDGTPITYHAGEADADITAAVRADLHTHGKVFDTRWVTVHDTDVDGFTPFDANLAAKAHGATPFKRPENGVFRPGSGFTEFFFDETGDTSAESSANDAFGGWGGLYRLTQGGPGAATGQLRLFFEGDAAHTGFDNLGFLTRDDLVAVEDRGDTLHTQVGVLDSAFVFDVNANYTDAGNRPTRMLAEGRDASATLDSSLGESDVITDFQNDGDNEITGFHVSNGDPSSHGLLGAAFPKPFRHSSDWRVFYTKQHGDNTTFEIVRRPRNP